MPSALTRLDGAALQREISRLRSEIARLRVDAVAYREIVHHKNIIVLRWDPA